MKNIAKKIKSKLSKRKGFTLAELLFSILILMLSTTIIIQCFNLGLRNVVRETRASEAQLLCSALSSSLQNELTYARDIKVSGDNLDTYFSSSRRMGAESQIFSDVNGELKIKNGSGEEYPLVAKSNYTSKNRSGGVGGGDYFLKAYLKNNSIQWDSTNQVFNVTIWVDDASKPALSADAAEKSALAYSQFSVKPLVVVK